MESRVEADHSTHRFAYHVHEVVEAAWSSWKWGGEFALDILAEIVFFDEDRKLGCNLLVLQADVVPKYQGEAVSTSLVHVPSNVENSTIAVFIMGKRSLTRARQSQGYSGYYDRRWNGLDRDTAGSGNQREDHLAHWYLFERWCWSVPELVSAL